jgi:putative transposase
MRCIECGSEAVSERLERTAQGYRRFRCRACGKQFEGWNRHIGLASGPEEIGDAVRDLAEVDGPDHVVVPSEPERSA